MKQSKSKNILFLTAVLAAFMTFALVFSCSTLYEELIVGSAGGNSGSENGSGGSGGGENQDTTSQFLTYLAEGTDGTAGTEAKYCTFGYWPQTIKAESVTVDETKSVTMGGMTYYLGSDSNYYAKCTENAYSSSYTYSNGDTVAQSSANSEKYFKVEPIKWRVLNPNASGDKILVAESILMAIPYYGSTSERTLNETTIFANNYKYSNIRAYLNGTKNQFVTDGETGTEFDVDWTNKGFLQTAFTTSEQSLIADTVVDNSADSTTDSGNNLAKATGFACDNTEDKIFLLSEKEATTTDYGFTAYNLSGTGNSRIRVTTDYAKANYAYQSTTAGYGGWWWIRTPKRSFKRNARDVSTNGNADSDSDVDILCGGVVPALSIKKGVLFIPAGSGGGGESQPEINYEFHNTPSSAGTVELDGSTYNCVYFGDFPQTIKANDVTVDERYSIVMGAYTYYVGSDGCYYAKAEEISYHYNGETYSDGTAVGGDPSDPSHIPTYKYFKVEPIKWRVLTDNYNETGKKLLFADSCLMSNITFFDPDRDTYDGSPDSEATRNIDGDDIYQNNYKYSEIRAYLNGLDLYREEGSPSSEYNNKGFLQTAFTAEAQSKIFESTVKNDDASTDTYDEDWHYDTENTYACADVNDKIFLLSVQEATNEGYGFGYADDWLEMRKLSSTDFALANCCRWDEDYHTCTWMLRSPHYETNRGNSSRFVDYDGTVSSIGLLVYYDGYGKRNLGIVPALCLN